MLLEDNRLGRAEALDKEINPGELKEKFQWGVFQAGLEALGKEVAKAKIQSDYA